ncbi:MAG: phosphatase PAP2 family protein [Bacteroidales bacterium]|jgi:undecaprenyl-diphosphatase|nr:phosphatase PAP2 family protein [Bacteroidales bacterium]
MSHLLQFDRSIFLYFNNLRGQWTDALFLLITNPLVWLPLIAFALFLIIKTYRKKAVAILIVVVISLIICDQTCNLIKTHVQRLRPSHDPALVEEVHLAKRADGTVYRGGSYSFPSGHAANSALFAIFIIYFLPKHRKWLIPIFAFWVLLFSYSRIYLGVHYPLDIFGGYLLASFLALLGIWGMKQGNRLKMFF